jgi:hypothetical protein
MVSPAGVEVAMATICVYRGITRQQFFAICGTAVE